MTTTTDSGFVLWLTGLSGAGKSTVAAKLAPALAERGHRVELLDGDEVRTNLCQGLGFSRADRDTNIARIGYVAGKLAHHGVAVLVAAISPYRQARDQVRASVDRFVEVPVAPPLDISPPRAPTGLYAKALAGEIPNFTGVSDPYEPPPDPEIVLHTEAESVDDSVDQVLTWLEAHHPTNPTNRYQAARPFIGGPAPGSTARWRSAFSPGRSPAVGRDPGDAED